MVNPLSWGRHPSVERSGEPEGGDGEMGRWGQEDEGWGDGEMGRWGDGEMGTRG